MTDSLFEQYKAALRRGHMAALGGDLDGALDAYGIAADLVPERVLPIASRATVLHRLGRWPEAAEAFDLALRMAPDDEAALRARARARDERGLRSGAAADFERLAFVLDIAGRSADAAEAARRAAELEPSKARDSLAARLAAAASPAPTPAAAPASAPAGAPDADLAPARHAETASPSATVTSEELDAALDAEQEAVPEIAADPGGAPTDEALLAYQRPAAPEIMTAADLALAARIAELGTQPEWVDMSHRVLGKVALGPESHGKAWPQVDLPSAPPPPLEGPPPDPETLLAEAAALIAADDIAAARDKMLLAATVHRAAGRLDAALEVCLQLLTTAPGDPHVHIAIANLQLDRGWTELATEKIELLLRLTSLTGDTQAEADVHGLASERLRDDALSSTAAR